MRAAFAVMIFAASGAVSAEDAVKRAYWASVDQRNRQRATSFSLPPATHFARQAQWEDYKRQYDERIAREVEEARRGALANMRPLISPAAYGSAFSPSEPRPSSPTGPSRAEMHGIEEAFVEVVGAFVSAESRKARGRFRIKDDRSGEVLTLKLAHIHPEPLRHQSASLVSGDADFTTDESPRRSVTLEFEIAKDWEWSVSRVFVRAINGRERYAFGPDGARVGVAAEPAAAAAPRPKAPAHLSADIRMTGSGGLSVAVSNAGPGEAYAVRLKLDLASAPEGVSLPSEVSFGDLKAGERAIREIALEAKANSPGGRVQATATVLEGNGFDTEPAAIEFQAVPPRLPALELADAAIEGGRILPGETARLSVAVRNAGPAPALGAKAVLRLGGEDLFMSGESSAALGDLAPGETRRASFEFFVNRRVKTGAPLPVFLSASDAAGRGFQDAALPLAMGQAGGPLKAVVLSAAEDAPPDADRPPRSKTPVDPKAFAVVVGVEKYRDVPSADYAARDAQAVYDYLTQAMGFRRENVALLQNERAGLADLRTYLGPWLADRATPGSRVFFFYSGHGAPNPRTGEVALVPYDGDPAYPETKGFPLSGLYASLGALKGVESFVALDSCFSGSGGRSVLPPGLRPLIAVRVPPVPEGVVVLSASGASQVSASHLGARHGLMTYFLLRALGGAADSDRDGRVTTLEIFRFVRPAVEAEARRQHIEQTPRLEPAVEALGGRAERSWVRL